jgi:hypothetical protein
MLILFISCGILCHADIVYFCDILCHADIVYFCDILCHANIVYYYTSHNKESILLVKR